MTATYDSKYYRPWPPAWQHQGTTPQPWPGAHGDCGLIPSHAPYLPPPASYWCPPPLAPQTNFPNAGYYEGRYGWGPTGAYGGFRSYTPHLPQINRSSGSSPPVAAMEAPPWIRDASQTIGAYAPPGHQGYPIPNAGVPIGMAAPTEYRPDVRFAPETANQYHSHNALSSCSGGGSPVSLLAPAAELAIAADSKLESDSERMKERSENPNSSKIEDSDQGNERKVRTHKCAVCGTKFFSKQNLSRHRHIHASLADKPHTCPAPGCDRRFTRSDHVQSHYWRIHLKGKGLLSQLGKVAASELGKLARDAIKDEGK